MKNLILAILAITLAGCADLPAQKQAPPTAQPSALATTAPSEPAQPPAITKTNSPPPQERPNFNRGRSIIKRDDFTKTTTVISPTVRTSPNGMDSYSFFLGAGKSDEADAILYSLVFFSNRDHSTGWAFWSYAYDKDGQRFGLKTLRTDVTPELRMQESCTAALPRTYLEALRASGTKWKAYGQRGTSEMEIPGALIQEFLDKVDEQFGKR